MQEGRRAANRADRFGSPGAGTQSVVMHAACAERTSRPAQVVTDGG
jgi:hypothetical protein